MNIISKLLATGAMLVSIIGCSPVVYEKPVHRNEKQEVVRKDVDLGEYLHSTGIEKAEIKEFSYETYSSGGPVTLEENRLELIINAEGKHDAEVMFDLRYAPRESAKTYSLKKSKHDKPVGVNLAGYELSAFILSKGLKSENNDVPSGVQVFAKSVKIVDGKEQWSSYYGNWHNIEQWRRYGAPKELGSVVDRKWSHADLRIPDKENLNAPLYGSMDKGFDPTNVAVIGIKYSTGEHPKVNISGKLTVRNFYWKERYPKRVEYDFDKKIFTRYDPHNWIYSPLLD